MIEVADELSVIDFPELLPQGFDLDRAVFQRAFDAQQELERQIFSH